MPSQTEIRQQITHEIIESLQQGIVPWKQPWSADPNCGRPTNAVTKKPYNGINVLLLTLHNQSYMSHSKYFATYRQWQSIGGQVMERPSGVPKGKWGAKVILYKPLSQTRTNHKGDEIEDNFCVMREYSVFNVEQVDNLGLGPTEQKYLQIVADDANRLNVIASLLGLPSRTVSEVTEPFLIRAGLIVKDDQGRRQLTATGRKQLSNSCLKAD